MRACLAAARLRLYPDFAAAAAPPGAPAPPGARLPPGRPSLRLLAAPASRLLRFAPAAVAASLRGSAPPLFPAAPWVAALPSRSLGGAVAVARRAWAPLRPRCARSPVSPPPAQPGSPPRLAPGSRSRGGLRGRLAGRCAPARRPAWWASRPPAFWRAAAQGVAAAAGKKAGLAAGFPGKRRIRTPFFLPMTTAEPATEVRAIPTYIAMPASKVLGDLLVSVLVSVEAVAKYQYQLPIPRAVPSAGMEA